MMFAKQKASYAREKGTGRLEHNRRQPHHKTRFIIRRQTVGEKALGVAVEFVLGNDPISARRDESSYQTGQIVSG